MADLLGFDPDALLVLAVIWIALLFFGVLYALYLGAKRAERAEQIDVTTERAWDGSWIAWDDDTYDGPDSPLGKGKTEVEAIADLIEQIEDRKGA